MEAIQIKGSKNLPLLL